MSENWKYDAAEEIKHFGDANCKCDGCRGSVEDIESIIAKHVKPLEIELETAKRDYEAMEWIEENRFYSPFPVYDRRSNSWQILNPIDKSVFASGKTIREAILAAAKTPNPKG